MKLKKAKTTLQRKPTYEEQRAIALQIIEKSAQSLARAYVREVKARGFPPQLWNVTLPKERGLTDSEQSFLNEKIIEKTLGILEARGFEPFVIVDC